MDRALAGLIIIGILTAGIGGGTYTLYWLLEHTLDTIDRIRRTR